MRLGQPGRVEGHAHTCQSFHYCDIVSGAAERAMRHEQTPAALRCRRALGQPLEGRRRLHTRFTAQVRHQRFATGIDQVNLESLIGFYMSHKPMDAAPKRFQRLKRWVMQQRTHDGRDGRIHLRQQLRLMWIGPRHQRRRHRALNEFMEVVGGCHAVRGGRVRTDDRIEQRTRRLNGGSRRCRGGRR